jgi:hypothetical protein
LKKPSTDELMKTLQSSNNIEQYMKENSEYLIDSSLSEYLNKLIKEKQLVKSTVIKKSELNEIYGYQIFSGTRMPSRDKLICLCIGMGLDLEETQQTLELTGLAPLYPKNKRDSIMIFEIQKQQNVCEINEVLYNSGENTLN